MMTLVWSRRVIGESSCTWKSCRESELTARTDFNQNSRLYIVLKLPHDPHTMLVFHWSQLTPTQCLFFIGHDLHPRNGCFPLVTDYTHAFLVSGYHFVDFIYGRMYLSTTSAGFRAGQGDILQNYQASSQKFRQIISLNIVFSLHSEKCENNRDLPTAHFQKYIYHLVCLIPIWWYKMAVLPVLFETKLIFADYYFKFRIRLFVISSS